MGDILGTIRFVTMWPIGLGLIVLPYLLPYGFVFAPLLVWLDSHEFAHYWCMLIASPAITLLSARYFRFVSRAIKSCGQLGYWIWLDE